MREYSTGPHHALQEAHSNMYSDSNIAVKNTVKQLTSIIQQQTCHKGVLLLKMLPKFMRLHNSQPNKIAIPRSKFYCHMQLLTCFVPEDFEIVSRRLNRQNIKIKR